MNNNISLNTIAQSFKRSSSAIFSNIPSIKRARPRSLNLRTTSPSSKFSKANGTPYTGRSSPQTKTFFQDNRLVFQNSPSPEYIFLLIIMLIKK